MDVFLDDLGTSTDGQDKVPISLKEVNQRDLLCQILAEVLFSPCYVNAETYTKLFFLVILKFLYSCCEILD